ncbi:MAG: NAD(P)-dependent alcohol dehydrogenase [Phycisphaerae bacterium]|nr:NAD(P)-dependent alcohol dehydrogenase [Phycisphaerae bacterium]
MRAITQSKYGLDSLVLSDIPTPKLDSKQILVKVEAASVYAAVLHLVTADVSLVRLFAGFRRPRMRPGQSFAGTVVEVGREVKDLRVGDRVCGTAPGAFADLVVARAKRVAVLPDGVDFDEASTIPVSARTALQAVRKHGGVSAGQKVLIIGASGCVGSFAVQIAVALGAEVTGVCRGAKKSYVRSLGARQVVDYQSQSIKGKFDCIIDTSSSLSLRALRRLLVPSGRLVIVGAAANAGSSNLGRNLAAALLSVFVKESLKSFLQSDNNDDLPVLLEDLAKKRITPVIGKVFTLEQSAQAVEFFASGRAQGHVVVCPTS